MRAVVLRLWPILLLVALIPAVLLGSRALSQAAGATITMAGPDNSDGAVRSFRMRFSVPMVPLGEPRAAAPVEVACPVAGTGRWNDQQYWSYEFEKPLPGGLTCSFTLRADLKSVDGSAVAGQRRYVVDTGGPRVRAILPGRYEGRIRQDQSFLVATNIPANRASIAAGAYCAVNGIGEKIPVDLLGADVPRTTLPAMAKSSYQAKQFLEEAGIAPAQAGSAAATRNIVALKCRRPLPPGRDMALVWGENISGGGRTAGTAQRFDFTVVDEFTARFECSRTNPQAGCSPVEPAYVRFAAPVPKATAAAIRIRLADGTMLSPDRGETDNASEGDEEGEGDASPANGFTDSVKFVLPADHGATAATVLMPAAVRDQDGRPLVNARRFPLPVQFDAAPPLVKFAATFGIIEANEGGVLPVTVRNVEAKLQGRALPIAGRTLRLADSDKEVAAWLRRLDAAEEANFEEEKRGGKDVTVNHTRDTPLLAGIAGTKGRNVPLPAKGKAFEVVGIALGAPGFHVVELASPTLGRALLGRDATRYVATGALVTNMAVHFKWGRGVSLAWVTALDSGKPVVGADIRVSDSCTGLELATGKSGDDGALTINGDLPTPQSYGSCESESSHPLMVSARRNGDFSFTLTSWNKGLQPYDFDMSFEYEDHPQILHTIFDRTLMRAGETVHMKHVMRRPVGTGFQTMGLKGTLRLTHRGSETEFDLPISIGANGVGENVWTAPKGAPQGDYDLSVIVGDKERPTSSFATGQSIRVDEYRLPTMRATIASPDGPFVRPKSVPVNLFVGYLSGGGAPRLPVNLRASFDEDLPTPRGWDGWTFGGAAMVEGVTPLDDDNRDMTAPKPPTQLLAATLDGQGAAHSAITVPATLKDGATMAVEMDYPDANGETLTASQRVVLYPAAIRVGMKSDGWLMKKDDLRLKFVVLGLDGKPVAGRKIKVQLYSRQIMSARRRLIGGFYAYENNAKVTLIDTGCSTKSDERGLAACEIDAGVSGEVTAVATVKDDDGNEARATSSIWLAGGDWWFGGDNGDRMDVVPEQREYKATDTARFQVRMPFRSATALVTVEREGVLASFVTTLSGKDPVVEVPLLGNYAPDVYVSVLAVRGRVAGWRLWLADFARRWHLPFFQDLAAPPTALVDLAKPSFRMGMAKISVGWDAHRLNVDVKTDRPKYHVRDTAQVAVRVTGADGKAPKQAEIAFVAIDEALLQLAPNPSWQLLDAMMDERPLSVLTSTAQMQVVGKRHYGRKAVATGGGGGGDLSQMNRSDFRPILLWKGRVPLNANGMARIAVPLSDSLSSFRMVAVATAGAGRFGTGQVSVRATQDLGIHAGLPPLVRSGDLYGAAFTLRNGSPRAMRVTARVSVAPMVLTARPITVTIPAGGAQTVIWRTRAPAGIDRLRWTVSADAADGRTRDRMTAEQQVVPAVPVDTWAATLLRVGPQTSILMTPPAGALPGRGGVSVRLTNSLSPPLDGVRDYMRAYLWDCFEQQLSKAVVAGDVGAWNRLAADIPAYLDREGLLRYFPDSTADGSVALTAYALSMTSEAGFVLPEGPRGQIIAALRGVVEGRIERSDGYAGDKRMEKLMALAALARAGAADPALADQIGIAPKDMQTSALVDWLTVVTRTAGLAPRAAEAETELRARIAYEGSRFDFTDSARSPWWLMSSADETAARALATLIGRPGWQDETPRLMMGLAMRQSRGHWDTTTANAWGVVAAKKFDGLYPPGAIGGTTRVSLAGQSAVATWPAPAPIALRLPSVPTPLLLAHGEGAGPWAQVSVTAAVPMKAAFIGGYRIARTVSVIQRRVPGRLSRGDVLRVRLTIDAGAERNWVVVNDPIPAGATIVGDLGGQSVQLAAQANGSEGASPSYVERGLDAWRGYYGWMPRGRVVVEYAVRLNAGGTFQLPPTRVQAMYSPEIRGALPNAPVTVALP
jgi:uncharacterized protein YfaS (alpha-2-macroglobulin family)